MKTLGGNEEMIHAFLSSVRDGGEWSALFSGRLGRPESGYRFDEEENKP
jgi:hypothetical protein